MEINICASIIESMISGVMYLSNNLTFALIWSLLTTIVGIFIKRYTDTADKDKRREALRVLLIHDIQNDIHYLREAVWHKEALQFFRHRDDLLSSIYVDLLLLPKNELESVLSHYSTIRNLSTVLQSTDEPTGYIPTWIDEAEKAISLLSSPKISKLNQSVSKIKELVNIGA